MISNVLARSLDEVGYVTLPNAMPKRFLSEVNARIDALFEAEGEMAGSEFKQESGCLRLANLVDKGAVFQSVVSEPTLLPYVQRVLGKFKLSSLNVRRVLPDGASRQPLHADMATRPDATGPWVCNVLWMMHDIDVQDGPLRVIPGTHRSAELPQSVLKDPSASQPDEVTDLRFTDPRGSNGCGNVVGLRLKASTTARRQAAIESGFSVGGVE